MASKIVKANGAQPDEFELSVAQEFANLEVNSIFTSIFGNHLLMQTWSVI
jgi:hypothetical protein